MSLLRPGVIKQLKPNLYELKWKEHTIKAYKMLFFIGMSKVRNWPDVLFVSLSAERQSMDV